jgi:hypothetical protein
LCGVHFVRKISILQPHFGLNPEEAFVQERRIDLDMCFHMLPWVVLPPGATQARGSQKALLRGKLQQGCSTGAANHVITEMRNLCMAARQGPIFLLFMSNRTRCILFISVMTCRRLGAPFRSYSLARGRRQTPAIPPCSRRHASLEPRGARLDRAKLEGICSIVASIAKIISGTNRTQFSLFGPADQGILDPI